MLPLIMLLTFNLTNCYSQTEVCKTPEENIVDLNEISIKKCDITEKKGTRKITKTNSTRKRISSRPRKSKNTTRYKSKNLSREVLFTLVEEIPMFSSCKKSTRKNNIKCFKTKIKKHFSKNFYAEKFNNETIEDKIFIKFSVDLYGNVINSKIKSKKNNKLLHKELNRILHKLPPFISGKEKGLPVIVTYSFPLNLTLN